MLAPLLFLHLNQTQSKLLHSEKLDGITEQLRDKNHLPNLYVTVVYKGQIIAAAKGYRDATGREPATVEDHYRIASVTKTLTSFLVLRMVASGKIQLTAPFLDYFDSAQKTADASYLKATVANLLTHTSGLSSPGTGPFRNKRSEESTENFNMAARLESVTKWAAEKPAASLGTYLYSNNGFCILGTLCERAGHKEFSEIMKAEVFDPLGMDGAGVGMPSSQDKITDPWYTPYKDGTASAPFSPTSKNDQGPTTPPQGGVYWNSYSAGMYLQANLEMAQGGRTDFLPRNISKLAFEPQMGLKDRTMVWQSWIEGRFGKAFVHNGGNSDYRGQWNSTHTRVLPSAGFAITVTTTTGQPCDTVKIANEIQATIIGPS